MNNCKTCRHWKNKQMLINYSEFNGFCVNPKFKFNIQDDRLIGVVDTLNLKDRTKVTGNCSNNIETLQPDSVDPSRYILQTNEGFGCNFYTKAR